MTIDMAGIKTARSVAKDALSLLGYVEKHLKSARNWGVYDLFGGGFFVSWIKHGRIKKADALLEQVSLTLEDLQRALCEVYIGLEPQINISGFERFMDIAFDNVISDWLVQSKIVDSLSEVRQVQADIKEVLHTLDRLEREQKN